MRQNLGSIILGQVRTAENSSEIGAQPWRGSPVSGFTMSCQPT